MIPRVPAVLRRRLRTRRLSPVLGVLMMQACIPVPEAGPMPETVVRWQAARTLRQSPLETVGDGGVRTVPVADSLVVATWNVHVGGGDITAFVGDLRSGRLTGGVAPGPFVILLQEVHRVEGGNVAVPVLVAAPGERVQALHHRPPGRPRMDILEVARGLDLHLVYAPALPNGRPTPRSRLEDRGVAILSSHRLSDPRVLELPRERQRRVALAGELSGRTRNGEEWRFLVASAHLENRSGWDRFLDSFGASRGRQARALARGLGEGPTILGGDLNTWAPDFMEPALDILRDAYPDSPETEGATFRAGGLGRQLDHLLLRHPASPRMAARVVPHRYGSDHHPVIGTVPLSGTVPPSGAASSPS